ncbi:hypothetical protein ACWGIP_34475, partial [Streptomyces sp. NPDC054838]
MGGWKHTELGGHTGPPPRRAARSAALTVLAAALAFGVLLWGAAFPCAGSLGTHGPGTAVTQAHGPAHDLARGPARGPAHADCVAPHELPGCAPRSEAPPAVLPVPPSALAAPGPVVAALARPAYTG